MGFRVELLGRGADRTLLPPLCPPQLTDPSGRGGTVLAEAIAQAGTGNFLLHVPPAHFLLLH